MGATVIGKTFAGRRRRRELPVVLATVTVLWCFTQPSAALAILVDASWEICAQHLVMVGHVRSLPPRDVLAVTDAGALHYLTDRRTYDLVGLTTPNAARAWNAGGGSIFEQIERRRPSQRPRWIAFYPGWISPTYTGRLVASVAIPDQSNVGGPVMELRAVHTELYRSGRRPRTPLFGGRVIDELDVADVTNEAAHDYSNLSGSRDANFVAVDHVARPAIADGGRSVRSDERFIFHAHAGVPARWILRVDGTGTIELRWNGESVGRVDIAQHGTFRELEIPIDASRVRSSNRAGRYFISGTNVAAYHDWLVQ
jgi:hypothetical protein